LRTTCSPPSSSRRNWRKRELVPGIEKGYHNCDCDRGPNEFFFVLSLFLILIYLVLLIMLSEGNLGVAIAFR